MAKIRNMRSFKLIVIELCLFLATNTKLITCQEPGETYPKHLEIEVGSSANITCNINPDSFNQSSAVDMTFWIDQLDQAVPRSDIVKLNDTAIMYMLRNATKQRNSYTCKCGNLNVDYTQINVGYKPLEVDDFRCRNYNMEYMVCNFTKPDNPVLTQYNLYIIGIFQHYVMDCDFNQPPHVVCNQTMADRAHYEFSLRSTNALGERIQKFVVDNSHVLVPAAPGENFHAELFSDRLKATWHMKKWDFFRSMELQWEVMLKPHQFEARNLSDEVKVEINKNNNNATLVLKDLPYVYWEYELGLRVKVRTAAEWSAPFNYTFRTKPRRPDRPPRTDRGSFLVTPSETDVRLYWEQLGEYEYNGLDFKYVISEVRMNGTLNSLVPLPTNKSYATYPWTRNVHYQFKIRSRNHLGDSWGESILEIHPFIKHNPALFTPQYIQTSYNDTNKTYNLTWTSPIETRRLINFTVFWCYSSRIKNECNGSIHFENVDKRNDNTSTKYSTTKREERHNLNFAVSANYEDYNTGLHWAACTNDVNSDLQQMEPEVQAMSATELKVQWSAENVCPSILEAYNLTYCEVSCEQQKNCDEAPCKQEQHSEKIDKDKRSKEIKNLKPYTHYKVQMFMYSSPTKRGRISEPRVVRTFEAAPSPPRQLEATFVGNTSAELKWLPPSQPNGKIVLYVVTSNDRKFEVQPNSDEPNEPMLYKLENLTAYTSYKVYVTARTIADSDFSNDIHFQTLIGYPKDFDTRIQDSSLQWTKPNPPNGRVEFYEVEVIIKRDKKVEQCVISIVMDALNCGLKIPDCIDHGYTTDIQVRAVNAALLSHEVSTEKSENEWEISDDNECTYEGSPEMHCTNGQKQKTDRYKEDVQRYRNRTMYRLYKSKWQNAYSNICTESRQSEITVPLLILIMLIVVVVGCYMVRHQYKEMSNITCQMPSGLEHYLNKEMGGPNGGVDVDGKGKGFANGYLVHAMAVQDDKEEEEEAVYGGKQQSFAHHSEEHHLLASMGKDSGYLDENRHGNVGSGSGRATGYLRTRSESSGDSAVDSNGSIEMETVTEEGDQSSASMETNTGGVVGGGGYIKPANILPQLKAPPPNNSGYVTVDSIEHTGGRGRDGIEQPQYIRADNTLGIINTHDGYVPPTELPKLNANKIAFEPSTNINGYTTLQDLNGGSGVGGGNAVDVALTALEGTTIIPQVVHPANANNTVNDNDLQSLQTTTNQENPSISGYVTQHELNVYGQLQQFS